MWENAGISGKNWEQLGDSDRKVGNSGNSWDNWIVPWRTCRTGDSKFLSPALGEMRRPSVPKPVTIGDFEHRKPSHGGSQPFQPSQTRCDKWITSFPPISSLSASAERSENMSRPRCGKSLFCPPAMTPLRPTSRKPYDANLGKSTMTKKFVTPRVGKTPNSPGQGGFQSVRCDKPSFAQCLQAV